MADDDLVCEQANPSDEVDRELVAAWREGDLRAGDQLSIKYFTDIRAYFIRRAPEEYEDLHATTFLKLAGSIANYRGEGTVRVFIYAIARNVIRQHLRSLRRAPEFDPITTSLLEAYGRRPSSLLSEQEELRILLDALQEIPSADQDLLELRYWHGLTGPELAALFEIPEGTLRGRLRAAVARLREKFQEVSEQPRELSNEQVIGLLEELGRDGDDPPPTFPGSDT